MTAHSAIRHACLVAADLVSLDLTSRPGALMCQRLSHASTNPDPRTLARWVSEAVIAASSTDTDTLGRVATQIDEWGKVPASTRAWIHTRALDLLNHSSLCFSPHRLHHHMGSIDGPLSIGQCTDFAMPHFTKPGQAFWTCPVLPGSGPTGFENLTGELDPDRPYDPYTLRFDPEHSPYVVETVADWVSLIERCGPDPTRTSATPDFRRLPRAWAGVHVTTQALLRFAAAHERDPSVPDLADWSMESTAWMCISDQPIIRPSR